MPSQSTNISSPHKTFLVIGICIALAVIASIIALLYGYKTWVAPQFTEGSAVRNTIEESRETSREFIEYGETVTNNINAAVQKYEETKKSVENTAEEIQETKEATIGIIAKLKNLFSNETKTEATVTD